MSFRKLQASALLFDMDGTIVDSGAVVEHAWGMWAARHGLALAEILAYSHGRPTLATMMHFGERIESGKDWRAEADEMQRLEAEQSGKTKPIAGARDLLARLPETAWAVITSAPRKLAEDRIRAAGLPMPRVLVPADEIMHGKPHPEGFLKAAQELGVAPARCIVFEDTPPGVEAGLSAGMQVVGLLTTVSGDRLRTKNLVRNYLDLTVLITDRGFQIEIQR